MALEKKNILAVALVASLLSIPLVADDTQPPVEPIQVTPAIEQIIDPELTTVEQNACVESLMAQYPGIFCRSNILVLDSTSDPDATHIKLFNSDLSEILSYKIAKAKTHPERGVWKNLKVLRRTNRLYSAGIKFDDKYKGYRESLIGVSLENILGLTKEYNGTVLLDEYKMFPLWKVTLRDRQELSVFLDYLLLNLAKRGKRSFDKDPVLLLTLRNDLDLETLTLEDEAKLKALFQVVDYRDTQTTGFFSKTQKEMEEFIMRFEAGGPIQLGQNTREKVFGDIEKYFKDFKVADMTPWIIGGTICIVAAWYFEHRILEPLATWWRPGVDRVLPSVPARQTP